jgi:hypothetical protein
MNKKEIPQHKLFTNEETFEKSTIPIPLGGPIKDYTTILDDEIFVLTPDLEKENKIKEEISTYLNNQLNNQTKPTLECIKQRYTILNSNK